MAKASCIKPSSEPRENVLLLVVSEPDANGFIARVSNPSGSIVTSIWERIDRHA